MGCSIACPHLNPSASCLLCRTLRALAARMDVFKVTGTYAHVISHTPASFIASNASIPLRFAGLSDRFMVDVYITPAAGGLVPHASSAMSRDDLRALMPSTVHIGHSG